MSRKVLTSHTTDALFGAGRPRREVECGELTRLPESNLILAFTYRHCLVAESEGFEPSVECLVPRSLSRGLPSTTRPTLHVATRRGIEPRYPTRQAGIITTI